MEKAHAARAQVVRSLCSIFPSLPPQNPGDTRDLAAARCLDQKGE